MGVRKKYWTAMKRDRVADGVRSNTCVPAAWKLVRTWYFFCQNGKKKRVFGLLGGGAKQIAEQQQLTAESLEYPGLISAPFYIFRV